MLKLFLLTFLINYVLCWKPIIGPTSFSIKQQHPAFGHSHITASDSGVSSALIEGSNNLNSEHTVTYHGNAFLDEHSIGHDSPLTYGVSGADETEGRILNHKDSLFYGSSLLEGLFPSSAHGEHCSTKKFAFENEGTIQYDHYIPQLEQFTLCAWMRFTNHTGDHSMFTYAIDGEPREIQFWVANAKGASYFSLAVHGQSLYRLNYPLKMRKWHHACTSWNGKTGEWQLWVKAERVGRGFHNRIVGHKIKPHGIVFSGGPSITGPVAEGLHLEITMVQLYKVALSAGKAHRDHKHHHVHHFDHDGRPTTTTPPPPRQPLNGLQQLNPLLANGQIMTRLRLNIAGQSQQDAPQPGTSVQGLPSQIAGGAYPGTVQQAATIGTQFSSGQFSPVHRFISQQLATSNLQQQQQQQQQQQLQYPSSFTFPDTSSLGTVIPPSSYANIGDSANVQFIDDTSNEAAHFLFKRDGGKKDGKKSLKKDKKDTVSTTSEIKDDQKTITKREIKKEKRALVTLTDGSVIDDRIIASNPFDFDGLASFGAPAFQQHLNKMMNIEDEIRHHDREAAEGEVQAVLQLCSNCDIEPFEGAVIMSWRDVKIHTEHALTAQTLGGCADF